MIMVAMTDEIKGKGKRLAVSFKPVKILWSEICFSIWIYYITMGARRDLNPQPSVPQTDALPIELRAP